MRFLLASSIVFFCACSHNALDPGAGSDPGSGTGTLLVTGAATATSNAPDAKLDTDFTTRFDIQLSLAGAPVVTGTVTMTSLTGTVDLTYQPTGGALGHWTGTSANYDEVYELNVTSGTDKITNVYVDGPDIHTFTAPMLGASLDSTATNTLTWSRGAAAQTATFRVSNNNNGNGDGLVIPDSGTYAIPALTLNAQKDQTDPNTLRLTRSNSVVPKGAVAGSSVSVGISNELDVVALACATCP